MARASICIQVSPITNRLTATSKAMAIEAVRALGSSHLPDRLATTATTKSLRPCIQPPLLASGQALNPNAKAIMISADGRVKPNQAANAPR